MAKKLKTQKSNFLTGSNDWKVIVDLPGYDYDFPEHIIPTRQRPDMLIFSESSKRIAMVELTIPFPTNVDKSHEAKMKRYEQLVEDVIGYDVHLFCVYDQHLFVTTLPT